LPQSGERTARRREERGDYNRYELVEEGIGKLVYVRAMGAGEGPDQGRLQGLSEDLTKAFCAPNGHLAGTPRRLRRGGRPCPDAKECASRPREEGLVRSLVGYLLPRSGGGLASEHPLPPGPMAGSSWASWRSGRSGPVEESKNHLGVS
jgi:hypothetical protein